jgi:hypothetical protein
MYVRQLHDRVTGSIQHGPLTAGVPMGADLPIVYRKAFPGPVLNPCRYLRSIKPAGHDDKLA